MAFVPSDALVATLVVAFAIAAPIPMNPTATPVASACVSERPDAATVTSLFGRVVLFPSDADTVPEVLAFEIAPLAPSKMPPAPATELA